MQGGLYVGPLGFGDRGHRNGAGPAGIIALFTLGDVEKQARERPRCRAQNANANQNAKRPLQMAATDWRRLALAFLLLLSRVCRIASACFHVFCDCSVGSQRHRIPLAHCLSLAELSVILSHRTRQFDMREHLVVLDTDAHLPGSPGKKRPGAFRITLPTFQTSTSLRVDGSPGSSSFSESSQAPRKPSECCTMAIF